jgi:hypothetical protein
MSTGNTMIDGDDGLHYFSPNYRGKDEPIMVHCADCGDLLPEEDLKHSETTGEDYCEECWTKQIRLAFEEGDEFN